MVSETAIQQQTRLLHCQRYAGSQNWRNNSGAGLVADERGVERMVRWGLANESPQENARIKSSDIIGITPVLIEPHMCGYWLGVFTALEIKPSGWHLTPGDKRGQAQAKFHQLVKDACGFAGFVTNPEIDLPRIIGR